MDGSDEVMQTSDRKCNLLFSPSDCSLPEQFICDKHTHCSDGVDECLCSTDNSRIFLDDECFRCLSEQEVILPIAKMCDGRIDCLDFSDECLCELKARPQICGKIQWGIGHDAEWIPRAKVACNPNEAKMEIKINELCDTKTSCKNIQESFRCNIQTVALYKDSRTLYCIKGKTYVLRCDQKIDCPAQFEEEECSNCGPDTLKICEYVSHWRYFTDGICDDRVDSPSREDELNCPGWFYCTDTTGDVFRVKPDRVCNAIKDCPDDSDESNCPPFACNDTGAVKYTHERQICDGTLNCAEGSDECTEDCIDSVFSDVKKMIKNGGIEALVWLIALTALIGNALVAGFTIKDVFSKKGQHKESWKADKMNKSIILNLSVSDLLVGAYTFAIAIKNSTERGRYCIVDHDWRSGYGCAAIGVLLVIGSQNSVFTMLIITFFRVRATSRMLYEPSFRKYFVTILFAWVVSVLLAVIPLFPSLEDHFVDSVWYENNVLFSTIDRKRADDMVNWLLLMNGISNRSEPLGNLKSWSTLEKLIKEMNPSFTVGRKYGFYSTHTVCLPTFFPNRKTDTAWWYSLLLISINMISFVAMAVGYFKIYRSATAENIARSKDVSRKRAASMQMKLTRIVFTDFCCWMPICIMGFVQLLGKDVPKDAYLPVALVILPINSALNPFLYSNIPDYFWGKIKNAFLQLWSRIRSAEESKENADGRVIEHVQMNARD